MQINAFVQRGPRISRKFKAASSLEHLFLFAATWENFARHPIVMGQVFKRFSKTMFKRERLFELATLLAAGNTVLVKTLLKC